MEFGSSSSASYSLATMSTLVGIDVGGTETLAIRIDGSGLELGRGMASGGHPAEVGLGGFAKMARFAAEDAGAQLPVDGVVIGIAGVVTETEAAEAADAVVRAGLCEDGRALAVPDVHLAQYGAFAGEPGIVVVAGTGSIAYGRGPGDAEARAAGLGPLFDDPGSGYDLVRRALIAAARAQDGRGRETVLRDRLLEALDLPDLRSLARISLAGQLSRREIASLAPLVLGAAEDGDREAMGILAWCTDELSEAARAVARQLEGRGSEERSVLLPVACLGGLMQSGVYSEALHGALRRRLRGHAVIAPEGGALDGAAALAKVRFAGE